MLTFTLAGHPPSPNRTIRAHFMAQAKSRATWREAARLSALAALRESGRADDYPLAVATVRIVWIVPDRRRRDPGNAVAACKAVIDGAVDAGLLTDDSFAVITHLSVVAERGPAAGVRIEVTEA